MREAYQKYWDLAAVLNLFEQANQIAPIDGNFKIQKLGFLAELRGQVECGLRAAHYKFFRYQFGPYSKDLANDVGFLKERGFLDGLNRLTDRGHYLVDYLKPEIEDNEMSILSLNVIGHVCNEYGRYSGPQLKRQVYDMTVPVIDYGNCVLKVKDIGYFTDILDPIRLDLRESANFRDDTLDDLKSEFNIPLDRVSPDNQETKAAVLELLQKIA